MIKAIFFDLDDCIFETDTISWDTFSPIVSILITHENLKNKPVEEVKKLVVDTSVNKIARIYNFSEAYACNLRKAYRKSVAPPTIKPFKDVAVLNDLPLTKILVTRGYYEYQHSKIKVLNISKYFKEIIVDEVDDYGHAKGKKFIFEQLMKKYNLKPKEVAVIGDCADEGYELKAGKDLGAITIQSLRPGVKKVDGFDYYVSSFKELKKIIKI